MIQGLTTILQASTLEFINLEWMVSQLLIEAEKSN